MEGFWLCGEGERIMCPLFIWEITALKGIWQGPCVEI